MIDIAIAPIPSSFLDRVRKQGLDDLGQPVKRSIAAGGEPCRDVLRRARPGEELILASFSPFHCVGPYREFGPIFVLANEEEQTVPRNTLPLPAGRDEDYLRSQFVFRAYSEDERILDATLCTPAEAEATVERFLSSPDVAFVHARFPTYGCFALRIDRAS